MGKFIDMTGQIYGDFKVIAFDNTKGKYKYYWKCKCIKCGYEKFIEAASLRTGHSQRCNSCNKKFGLRKINGYEEDLTGQTFGKLIVQSFEYSKSSHSYWKCKCSCGNEITKSVGFLRRGVNLMCNDCIKKSNEEAINVLNSKREYRNTFVPIITHKNKRQNEYEFKNDYVIINGNIYIDQRDFKFIDSFKRYISIGTNGYAYFQYIDIPVYLHRLILELPISFDPETNLIAEHIDGNKLNNRSSNLRICNKQNNPMNAALYSNNTTGHKGVEWLDRLQKYQVSISCNNKNYYLGVYSSFNEAVKVREQAEKEMFGEFSRAKEYLFNK